MSQSGDEMILGLAAALQGQVKTAAVKCDECGMKDCKCDHECPKCGAVECKCEPKKAMVDILQGLTKLAAELDELGAEEAGSAVDDALRIIVRDLGKDTVKVPNK